MLGKYITIDGGTTNTRVSLVADGKILSVVKLEVGARASIDGKAPLVQGIKKAIADILAENELTENDIEKILASGMITSEFGLCNLPHINTPAGISELHDNMYETEISEISGIPFVFIRGVKMLGESAEGTDMMRGEETELMGILNTEYGKCIYVLPGSHSKVIKTNDDGRIADFSTMLTGEMIASLSQGTILKDAVDLGVSENDRDYLLRGYDCCSKEGLNKALFKVRILKNLFGCGKVQTYSFFLGAVLCGEIMQIINNDAKTVVLGGKAQIKNAMAEILKSRSDKNIIVLDEKTVDLSTSLGMVRVFEGKV